MKRPYWLFAECVLAASLFAQPMFAAAALESAQPAAAVAANPNVAVIYWQAFAAMPVLGDEQKQRMDVAIKAATGPVADDLRPTLALFEPALRELHRARTVSYCDWEMNYEAGPYLLMPHLQRARELSGVTLLRARVRFAAGETAAAVSDVVAVLKLARDGGVSPLLIPMLVDVVMEKNAIELLATNLPSLKPEQLDQLAVALKQLPATASFADCIRGEARTNGGWVERLVEAEATKVNDPQAGFKVIEAFQKQLGSDGDVDAKAGESEQKRRREMLQSMTIAEVRESIRRMQADYAEMAKIASLSTADQVSRWTEFESQLAAAIKLTKRDDLLRYFSMFFLPQGSKTYDREEHLHLRRQLIELAVQVQRYGPEAIQSAKAIGNGKVEYRKTDGGFELHCPLASSDKTLSVSVGAKK